MIRLSFIFILLTDFCLSIAQVSVEKISSSAHSTNDRWKLKEFLWSHNNYDSRINDKPVIDFDAVDNWPVLGEYLSISNDGQFVAYTIDRGSEYHKKLDTLVVQSTIDSWRQAIIGAEPGFFSRDNKQYIFQDQKGLCFLQTGSSERKYVEDVAEYNIPYNGRNDWFVYQLKDVSSTIVLHNLADGIEKRFASTSTYGFDPSIRWFACQLTNDAKELVVYELDSQKEERFPSVVDYTFDFAGNVLVLKTLIRIADGISTTQLRFINLSDGSNRIIWSSTDSCEKLNSYSFDKTGSQLVFTTSGSRGNVIWYWQKGMDTGVQKVNNQTQGIDPGLVIGKAASFTNNDRYIQLVLQCKPDLHQPKPDAAQLDVWSYRDTLIQSAQQVQLGHAKTFTAILNPANGSVIRLNGENETVGNWIPGGYAIITKQCCGDRFWENGYLRDSTWVVSLETGTRVLLPVFGPGYAGFTADGRYLVYFDSEKGCNFFSYNLSTGKLINISAKIPPFQLGHLNYYLRDAVKNKIFPKMSMIEAWIGSDKILVCDDYDIWQLDVTGLSEPLNITNGYGKLHHIKFELSGEGKPFRLHESEALLLKAFNRKTKYSGYFVTTPGLKDNPDLLFMGPCFIERLNKINALSGGMPPMKAKDAMSWIIRKETASDAPNYFLTHDFKKYKQITFLAPQKKYNWYSTELHQFKQLDGSYSNGVLYKPENFDPKKKYPVIVSFYTNLSDNLFQYAGPDYVSSPIIHHSPAWMVSHGYLVFVPDIYFTNGKWGPSTVNTMDGAAKYLRSLSYVDAKRLGAVGHSNSGRFGYYLLTHSNSFAAMCIGSGFTGTNVISLALSIDFHTGKNSNLEVAESTAVGTSLGNLWKNKNTWIDHTAVLHADKTTSPLLLFHNKRDTDDWMAAVQLYTAFRRLEKPLWWLQYDLGDHVLGNLKDLRDFTIRYTQYFDHYLKEAPAPRWMTQGVPASLKAIESRYEFDYKGKCEKDCSICKKWNAKKQ